jgi:hypothetical protein
MKRQSHTRRVFVPILTVLAGMVLSTLIYDLSRGVENPLLHKLMSHTGAVGMFLSIWMGALFANTMAFFRGASFAERMLVCLATPIVWSAKVLSSFIGIYSTGEFLFLLLHHFIIGCPLVALLCMGISEIWCRMIARKKGPDRSLRVFGLGNSLLLLISFVLVALMLWNGGHAYYYLYMDVYGRLFL